MTLTGTTSGLIRSIISWYLRPDSNLKSLKDRVPRLIATPVPELKSSLSFKTFPGTTLDTRKSPG